MIDFDATQKCSKYCRIVFVRFGQTRHRK